MKMVELVCEAASETLTFSGDVVSAGKRLLLLHLHLHLKPGTRISVAGMSSTFYFRFPDAYSVLHT